MTSCTIVWKKGRSSGFSIPRRLAMAIPMAMAATRPVSSRKALHEAADDHGRQDGLSGEDAR